MVSNRTLFPRCSLSETVSFGLIATTLDTSLKVGVAWPATARILSPG
jgi:hypothetical protein